MKLPPAHGCEGGGSGTPVLQPSAEGTFCGYHSPDLGKQGTKSGCLTRGHAKLTVESLKAMKEYLSTFVSMF